MGKRKHADKSRERLLKKIKKLEEKIRRISSDSDSSDEDIVASPIIQSLENKENEPPALEDIEPEMFNEVVDCEEEPIPEEEEQLEENVLEILGVAPQTEAKGENLHKQIVERWAVIVKKGLDKEEKEKIQIENPPFTNFSEMTPPKLNPEVNAAVNDVARKRDQIIFKRQQQVSTALSCLGSALQLSMKDQKLEAIKKLNDASRLLCDSLFMDTRGRRSLLLSVTNKNMKDFLVQSEPGSFLFGDNLTDQIKAAKSVQKSGEDLKIPQVKKFTPRPTTSGPKFSGAQNKSLNWRGPPRGEAKKRGGHHRGQQAPRQADRRPPEKKDPRRK
ncbi:uncharacterized protein LOC123655791 [Melitaea cinxia]|uniref:uncharacterized protein LOC123655791 n=1 Tax=Melitaea cinxia TaxID=113334 RepID=UPI001E26FA25|nr:uncharacterized protein LOC123655791 [Melitaea cinxia]